MLYLIVVAGIVIYLIVLLAILHPKIISMTVIWSLYKLQVEVKKHIGQQKHKKRK